MDDKTKELLSLGVKLFKEGDFESAEDSFKQALDLEPENALIHNNYAMLLKKVERLDDAELHFRTALELDPQNTKIHKNFGKLLKAKNSAIKEKEKKEEKAAKSKWAP
jgi:Tfp pilus assembly protein PilF